MYKMSQGFIYVMAPESMRPTKLGLSEHPVRRRRELEILSGLDLSIIALFKSNGKSLALERFTKRDLLEHRAYGQEWFNLEPDAVIQALYARAAKQGWPLQLLKIPAENRDRNRPLRERVAPSDLSYLD